MSVSVSYSSSTTTIEYGSFFFIVSNSFISGFTNGYIEAIIAYVHFLLDVKIHIALGYTMPHVLRSRRNISSVHAFEGAKRQLSRYFGQWGRFTALEFFNLFCQVFLVPVIQYSISFQTNFDFRNLGVLAYVFIDFVNILNNFGAIHVQIGHIKLCCSTK